MSTATVRPPKPPSAHVDDQAAENIPLEMRVLPCWVAWRWERRDGKWTKPPIDPLTGNSLDATGPDSWMTFDKARELARRHGDGIGLALGEKGSRSGFVPPDIDHCIDDQGNVDHRALDLVKRFDSYTERTPSGRGLRIWVRGKKPGDRCKAPSHKDKFLASIELYEYSRYLTVTGRKIENSPSAVATRQMALDELYGAMFRTGGKTIKATASPTPAIPWTCPMRHCWQRPAWESTGLSSPPCTTGVTLAPTGGMIPRPIFPS